MGEIRAEVLAERLLKMRKPHGEIVEATGLEPREVAALSRRLGIPQVAAVQPVETPKPAVSPVDWIRGHRDALTDAAAKPHWSAATKRGLLRAADALGKAIQAAEEDAGKAAIRAEIQRLKAKQKQLEAQLSGRPAKSTAASSDSRAVRAWAREHGMDVSDVGKVPASIVAAFEAAHEAAS